MGVKNITAESFDGFIKEGKTVIDFHADWCGPCRVVSPIVDEVSGELKDINFGKVDVDKESELAQRFQVMSIPTLLFFNKGEQVDRYTGSLTKEELVEKAKAIK